MKLYLLGGRPCSGKTTLACCLGQNHNIDVLYLDTFAQKYIEQSTIDTPNIFRWKNKDLVQVLQKNASILFDEYIGFYEEMFPILLDELKYSYKKDIIMEGSILLPKFIDVLKEVCDVRICYFIADDDFVRQKYEQRDYAQEMITKVNGKEALENLLERDSIFAKYILRETEKYSLPTIHIKDGNDIESDMAILEKLFGL